jgi:hypothetical protein
MTNEPLHAVVDGKKLRFVRSPNNDGRPDFPGHSTDDLQSVFGLNRAQCRIMTTMWWNGRGHRAGLCWVGCPSVCGHSVSSSSPSTADVAIR